MGSVLCRFGLLSPGLVVPGPPHPVPPDLSTARRGAGGTNGSGGLEGHPWKLRRAVSSEFRGGASEGRAQLLAAPSREGLGPRAQPASPNSQVGPKAGGFQYQMGGSPALASHHRLGAPLGC